MTTPFGGHAVTEFGWSGISDYLVAAGSMKREQMGRVEVDAAVAQKRPVLPRLLNLVEVADQPPTLLPCRLKLWR